MREFRADGSPRSTTKYVVAVVSMLSCLGGCSDTGHVGQPAGDSALTGDDDATCGSASSGADVVCADATPCDDADSCTYDDVYTAGQCAGTAVHCASDSTVCGATRSCDGTAACVEVYATTSVSCDDLDSCTYDDHCDGAGLCGGTAISCTDAGGTCGENSSCNGTDTCTTSFPDSSVQCDDLLGCTIDDQCDSSGGCGGTDFSCTPRASNETLLIDGDALPGTVWAIASDPDLVKLGPDDNPAAQSWWMFFTGISFAEHPVLKLNVLAAYLPAGAPLSSNDWTVLTGTDDEPIPIIPPGAPGSWDEHACETASYVRGYDNTAGQWVDRIYYTGWKIPVDGSKDYRVGFSQWDESGGAWVKNAQYVLQGEHDWELFLGQGFLGDQTVYYEPGDGVDGAGGTWHMWYQSTTTGLATGVGTVTVHATSTDGVSWPLGNRAMVTHVSPYANNEVPHGPYHIDVTELDGRLHFVGWAPSYDDPLTAEDEFAWQGLWTVSSASPTGSSSTDFSDWQPLLFDQSTTSWRTCRIDSSACSMGDGNRCRCHQDGMHGSTLVFEDGDAWLFYHAAQDGQWAGIGRAAVNLQP